MSDVSAYVIAGARPLGGEPADLLLDDGVIAEVGAGLTRGRRRRRRRRRAGRAARPGRPAHPPARARPRGRRDRRAPAPGRPRSAASPRCTRWPTPTRSPTPPASSSRSGGSAARPATATSSPVGAVTVGLGGRAAGRARRDGRLGGPGPGLLRRRHCVDDARADAPGAGVRQGLRRRHRPARPGAAAHRGRADERGRRCPASSGWPAGRRSPRRRSSPATCCSPSTSARGCTSATCRPPARSRSSAGPRRAGIDVTAEVTPHHLLLTDELAATYDPVFKVNPPLRTEADVEALRDGAGRRHDRRRRHRPRAARRSRTRTASGPRRRSGCSAWRPRSSVVAAGDGRDRAARLGRRRRPDVACGPARIGRLAGHGRPLAVGEPANLVAGRPGGARGRSTPTALASAAAATRRTPAASCPAAVVATFLRGRPTVLDGKPA